MDKIKLNDLVRSTRQDFIKGALTEEQAEADPFRQFAAWLDFAFKSGNQLSNAMVLSTVDKDAMPSSRIMLLRDISFDGFTFFTNYDSKKGRDIRGNQKAALLFFWPELERQVRVQGIIKILPEEESEAYFQTRPFESRVGAWASQQSEVTESRAALDENYQRLFDVYKGQEVPRPPYWGGYVLIPSHFEFWQGRAGRLHDRLSYRPHNGQWTIKRLMP